MWRPVFAALLALGGCAQLAGIEVTTSDNRVDAMPNPPDARPCLGGDARVVDPASGACYMYFATPMIRDAAREICRGFGPTGHLASIQSVAESALIVSLIGTTDAFIGGTDEVTETKFVWEDGAPIQLTNWNTGEPNNGAGMFEEDCIVMIGSLDGKWNDVPCAPPPANLGTYPFVCERD